MSLDNYTDLQAAIANWLNRGDLTSQIPDFISLAETQMLRRFKMALNEGKPLPRSMLTQNAAFPITAGAEYVNLPSDFLGVLSFSIDAQAVQLDYVGPQNLVYLKQKRGITASEDTPGVFTIIGSQFQFLPIPDQTYTGNLWYWQKFATLSASNATNWILANHPDAYLYGALTAAAPYLMDDARLQTWGNLFLQAIADVIASDPLPSDRSWLRMDNGLTFRPNSTTTFNINTGDFTYGP
jgi:hypothetical protein